MKSLYLILNIATIIIPLAFSFESKLKFVSKWKYILPAIVLAAVPFLLWDYYFTVSGVWGFNPEYVIGVYLSGMPIEEWLFFFCIPYACIFMYESLPLLTKTSIPTSFSKAASYILILLFITLSIIYSDRTYTITVSLFAVFILLYNLLFNHNSLNKFYPVFVITLLPFFIVNGILTSLPVVSYNDFENMGVRIFSIPVEDSIYWFSLFLLNIMIYEKIKSTHLKTQTHA